MTGDFQARGSWINSSSNCREASGGRHDFSGYERECRCWLECSSRRNAAADGCSTRRHGTKSDGPAMAFLSRQLQTPAGLIIKYARSKTVRQHKYLRTMPARPTRVFRWDPSGRTMSMPRQIDATLLQRRRIGLKRWRHPGNPAGLAVVRAARLRHSAGPMPASVNATHRCRIVQSEFQFSAC